MKRWLLVLFWAACTAAIYGSMSHGPGVSPDSIIYIETARSILAGHGLTVHGLPMTHFPPLYPLLIAATGLLDHDLLHAARLLATLCFGVNLLLVGCAVYFATGGRLRPAACAAVLLVVSAPVIELHTMAWSEGPFVAFTLAGLLVLSATVGFHRRRMLALAALCLGLAAATRYAGIVLFPVLCLVLWFMGERSWRDRVIDTLVALPIALFPLGWWMVRNAGVTTGVTDRRLVWHPVTAGAITQMIETLGDTLFPLPWSVAAKLALLLGLLALLVVAWRRQPADNPSDWSATLGRNLPRVTFLFSVCYAAFLLLSISIADAGTPLDDRILYPLVVMTLVAGIVVGDRFVHSRQGPWLPLAVLAGVLLSLGLRAGPAWQALDRIHRDGNGYNSDAWRNSPAIAHLRPLPPRILVYSNASEAIGYLTARRVMAIPDSLVSETLLPNPHYRAELDALCRRVLEGRAVAVYLTTEGIGDPDEKAHLEGICPFPTAADYPDGTLYGADSVVVKPPFSGVGREAPHPGIVALLGGRVGQGGEGSYIPPPKAR